MLGIGRNIVEYKIPLYQDVKQARQKLRWMKPEYALKIKKEVEKQVDASFPRVVQYPQWVVNIVS